MIDLNGLPPIIVSFLSFKLNIQGCSPLTVNEYLIDIRCFFRYVIHKRTGVPEKQADLSVVDAAYADSITMEEVYGYLMYLANMQSKPTTRSRKLSTIRAFYKFHTTKSHMLTNNPAKEVDPPKKPMSLPIVMSLEESRILLNSFDKSDIYYRRNFLIVLIFLNCGIRLSELVGINLTDIDSDMQRFTVRGKGNKVRSLYFNSACREALVNYLLVRQSIATSRGRSIKDKEALFLSSDGRRISQKTVQWMLKRQLEISGLDQRGYSVHKLRHTAATLMYNEGNVDVLMLKEILGHAQLNTTQIYTHIKKQGVQLALENNPLNEVRGKRHGRRIRREEPVKPLTPEMFFLDSLIMEEYRRRKKEGLLDGND